MSNRRDMRIEAHIDGRLVASFWWGSLRSPPPYECVLRITRIIVHEVGSTPFGEL